PAGLPARLGGDFLLTGYRVFARFPTPGGRTMRGLRILRSDTDSRVMTLGGNLLTRYHYRLARISCRATAGRLDFRVESADGRADLDVSADLHSAPAPLPAARPFAGPLPYTFEYEPQTGSVIVIKAHRAHWEPRPVAVEVRRLTFFERGPLAGTRPLRLRRCLAAAHRLRRRDVVRLRPLRAVRLPLAGRSAARAAAGPPGRRHRAGRGQQAAGRPLARLPADHGRPLRPGAHDGGFGTPRPPPGTAA